VNIRDYVREIGTVEDIDGRKVTVGVDYDSVTVSNCARLDAKQAEEFSRLFAQARMAAAQNRRRMDEEAADDAADALDEVDAGFPLVPAAQIAAEAAAGMRRLVNGG
jgi:hypothetical protein